MVVHRGILESTIEINFYTVVSQLVMLSFKWRKWIDMWPSMVTHTRNLCSAINPSKVHTHSSEHTHTVNTHPEQWAAIYAAAPGEQLGVRCLAQGHLSRGIEGGESAVHSPHLQFLPDLRLELATFIGYESNSLTIRTRLPNNNTMLNIKYWAMVPIYSIPMEIKYSADLCNTKKSCAVCTRVHSRKSHFINVI